MKNGTGIGSITSRRPGLKFHCGNTPLLTTIERIFNRKIYKSAATIYNAQGEAATLAYMQQFVISDIREVLGVGN
jgi:hypothetical protein